MGFEVQSTRIASHLKTVDTTQLLELDQKMAQKEMIACLGPISDPSQLPSLQQTISQTQNLFFCFALENESCGKTFQALTETILNISSESGGFEE